MSHPAPKPAYFDPRALLNPKAAGKAKEEVKDPPNAYDLTSPNKSTNASEAQGLGTMIERVHKVEQRQERPAKKQKQNHAQEQDEDDQEEFKKKAQFNGVGGSGEMGAYLKEQREKLEKENGDPMTVVDLTVEESEESEDDEVVIVKDNVMAEVCLGRIENARVHAHKIPSPKSSFVGSSKYWTAMSVTLERRTGTNFGIACRDPRGGDFGNIDQRVSKALAPLMDGGRVTRLRVQARLDVRPKKPFDYPGQGVSENFPITINIYAQKKYVGGIGNFLSVHQIWLRDPLLVDRDIEVINPHKPKDFTPKKTLGGPRVSTITQRTIEEVRSDVLQVLDTIQEAKDLPEMDAPSAVTTNLLPHQKQAVYFMNKREQLPLTISKDSEKNDETEEKPLWSKKISADGRTRWLNVITGHQVKTEPSPLLGGMLADVMGLGKTLNILSLVIGSMDKAAAWAKQEPEDREANVKGTLLVCPLSTIVNWEDQIKTHLKKGSLKYYIYQGPNRTNHPLELCEYDLVITTYPMVGSEFFRDYLSRPNKPIFDLNWFRVVLDEAHMIRNSSSGQSKAACEISAPRRWCVTGTPVQNRLEDLGALIRFLKIKPFEQQGMFSTWISTPLRTGNAEAIPKLRILVDSITLRRLKDKLDLPQRTQIDVKLKMSDSERNLYDQFSRDTNKKVDAMVGLGQNGKRTGLRGKSYAQVLKAIGRLRMLCAHGGDMLSEEDWDIAKGFDAINAIDLEDDDDFSPDKTPSQAFEMLRLMKEANVNSCARCNNQIDPEMEELDEEEDETFGFLTQCNQLLCTSCIKEWREEMRKEVGADNRGTCTICGSYTRFTSTELKHHAFTEDAATQAVIQKSRFARNLARYTQPHTKTYALLEELEDNNQWSKDHPEEAPIKSVVFSEWTQHLDLIQMAFTSHKITYTRLDGTMSFSQRTSALNKFETNKEMNVILVSLKAGGLGLNLTAASRVYVMEPNYNPAAEQQAIERVHRLGQKRDVVIKRFLMAHSIEEKVVKLQERKIELAKFSVDRSEQKKLTSAEKSKKTLEDLKSLLR